MRRAQAARWTIGLVALMVACPAFAAGPTPTIDVLHYAVALEPDLASGRIQGTVAIDWRATQAGVRQLAFDAGELEVTAVSENGEPLTFNRRDAVLQVDLPDAAQPRQRRQVLIRYHGAPRYGLEFHRERDELYTIFSSSQWMVCVDAPHERATLDLRVSLPAGLVAAGTGRAMAPRRLDDGREQHRWRLREPAPSFVYGFAAGRYSEARERVGGVRLRYLGQGFSTAQLQQVFADSGDMLRFFARRAGLRPRGDYQQALVAKTIGQELAGLALMSDAYGRKVLDGSENVGLIAHEIAHQWWGVRVTNRDWGHFWLNEGFATFMAAAYLQHRLGDEAYLQQVQRWQQRVAKLRESGSDHALVYQQWRTPSADDRAVVYQKGALALHELRVLLGEDVFWRGIRRYTRRFDGQSVVTDDFRRTMEQASGLDLGAFFAAWATPMESANVSPVAAP